MSYTLFVLAAVLGAVVGVTLLWIAFTAWLVRMLYEDRAWWVAEVIVLLVAGCIGYMAGSYGTAWW